MNDKETTRIPERKTRYLKAAALLLAILATLAAWALFTCWTVQRAGREMRADLLRQTRMVAQVINVERIRALSGTEADLNNDHYVRLKEQLAAIRLGNPNCRFLYLMGRKVDGAVFFFVDSERVGSKNYSPPGQICAEVPAEYHRVFDTKAETVAGPASDRWGTWLSGLVPISDPQTAEVLAVLVIGLDASTWKRNIAERALMPVGLMFVMLVGVFAACCSLLR